MKNKEQLKGIVGVEDIDFALYIISGASSAVEPFLGKDESLKQIIYSMHDIKPKDSVEARLIAQSAVLYEYAMKSLKRSGEAEQLCHIEAMGNLGIKLMRVHNETIETLTRYKRGGEQKVTVTHAVVAGQAIVNNFNGEGAPVKNQGESPCSADYAERKQEQITISHVDSQQWQMESVGSTEEEVQVRGVKKGKSE